MGKIHTNIPIIHPQYTTSFSKFFKSYFNYDKRCYIVEHLSIRGEIEVSESALQESKHMLRAKIATIFTGIVPMISAGVLFVTWIDRKIHRYVLVEHEELARKLAETSINLTNPGTRTLSLRPLDPKTEKVEASTGALGTPPSPGRPRPFRIGRHEIEDNTTQIEKISFVLASLQTIAEVQFDDDIDFDHPEFLPWLFAVLDHISPDQKLHLSEKAIPTLANHIIAHPDDHLNPIIKMASQSKGFLFALILQINPQKNDKIDKKRQMLTQKCLDLIENPDIKAQCIDELFATYYLSVARTLSNKDLRDAFDRHGNSGKSPILRQGSSLLDKA